MGSTSSNTNDTASNTEVRDERIAADGEAQVFRTGGNVNILDGGAIDLASVAAQDAFEAAEGLGDAAAKISLDGFDSIERIGREVIDLSERFGLKGFDIARDSLDLTNKAFERLSSTSAKTYADFASRSRSEQAQGVDHLIQYAIPAIVIIFVARSYIK